MNFLNSHLTRIALLLSLASAALFAQDTAVSDQPLAATEPGDPGGPVTVQPGQLKEQPPPDKRIFGVLPNYRTANETPIYTPISTKTKFIIGAKDSFDYPLLLLSGAIAGLGQITDQHPGFGQGMAGFGRRLGTAYADEAIGNMMTESIFPTFLHEDPRYFRRGYGSVGSRIWYAATRVFVTRTDSGGTRFNFSEVLGNATAAAISNAYYPDGRDPRDNAEKWVEQIGIDSVSQVLKEFWPDIKQKLFHRNNDTASFDGH